MELLAWKIRSLKYYKKKMKDFVTNANNWKTEWLLLNLLMMPLSKTVGGIKWFQAFQTVSRTLTLNQQWHQSSQILMSILNQGKKRTATELINLIMALKRPLLDLSIGSTARKHCLTGSNWIELIFKKINL